MTRLAMQYDAVNLSQGLPDFTTAHWVSELAIDAIKDEHNQQAPAKGLISFRETLSDNYKQFQKLNYDPVSDITITTGASEAIFCTIMALVNPGDEVIVFEPFFDIYIPAILAAGGVPKTVTLHAPEFRFDYNELKKTFSKKTKLVILNSPHNPTGKIIPTEDLNLICSEICKWDSYLISDEVYEYLLYDNTKHISPATIDGMKERTITISSASKTFGMTGWRIGWSATTPEISSLIDMIHQNITFSAPRPMQEAYSKAFQKLHNYIPKYQELFVRKRDKLFNILKGEGFKPILPNSTYYIICPINQMTDKSDIEFCKELITKRKVAAIPLSAFYNKSLEGEKYIRFCFAKKDETLSKAFTTIGYS